MINKRKFVIGIALLSVMLMLPIAASATSPHWLPGYPVYTTTSDGALRADFRAAGFGAGQTVQVSLTADTVVTRGCVTPPGNNEPTGLVRTKETLAANTTITADRHGNVRGPVILAPSLEGFTCPSARMTPVLVSVEYTNIVLTVGPLSDTEPGPIVWNR